MDTAISLDAAYLVALVEPDLPGPARMQAELDYCRELERRLGRPEDVAHALRAVARLTALDDEPSGEAATLLLQWQLANHAARQAALAALPAAPDARFEVRLAQ